MKYHKGKGDSMTREMAEQNGAKKLQGVKIVMNRNKCEENLSLEPFLYFS